jgi:hypothetical protein
MSMGIGVPWRIPPKANRAVFVFFFDVFVLPALLLSGDGMQPLNCKI